MQKDYPAAVILAKNALQENPMHLPSRILLGQSLLHSGDALGAEKDLKTALASGADEEQVVVLLGSSYLIQGKYQQLLNEVKSGGRATDIETQILVLRAHAYLNLGQTEEAEKSFTRARRLLPSEPGPILGLATVEIQKGNLDLAA
ncbi:MAG: tetratricopeptide repeat protein, partial [Gammaproteobacteria bacterium]|nr:tetratricopeptide repeat protein [Gammaproteobacteria bacterium]